MKRSRFDHWVEPETRSRSGDTTKRQMGLEPTTFCMAIVCESA
jgi:hypothetical protein